VPGHNTRSGTSAHRAITGRTENQLPREGALATELNEAFAAQVPPVCRETGVDIERQLNPHGGAIVLGHPFGVTGARIMTTLINGLQSQEKSIGLETMCAAGGMAMAMIIERLA
jgi:acetyl-CoA C-acetyltransferase